MLELIQGYNIYFNLSLTTEKEKSPPKIEYFIDFLEGGLS